MERKQFHTGTGKDLVANSNDIDRPPDGRSQASGVDPNDNCLCCKEQKHIYKYSMMGKFWSCTLDELETAAKNECLCCSFLVKCIACIFPGAFQNSRSYRVAISFPENIKLYTLDAEGIQVDFEKTVEIFSLPDDFGRRGNIPFGGAINKRHILPESTASEATFTTIRSWLMDCTSKHGMCNKSTTHRASRFKFPKRILELYNGRVLLRENVPHQPYYACLSHCWGTSQNTSRTTKASLNQFRTEIPWDRLTKTFQDAVDICRRLGIAYLWIDSLCILQDSEEDWREQSSRMAEIYENALLTIAAAHANEGSKGCYISVDPELLLVYPVPGYDGVFVRKMPPVYPTEAKEGDLSMASEWPLLSRGWVYQEMRLSTRILYFGPSEVILECLAARRSQSGWCELDPSNSSAKSLNPAIEQEEGYNNRRTFDYYALIERKWGHVGLNTWPNSTYASKPTDLWHQAVLEYSQLGLTFYKDRLPAFSALAQRMKTLRVDDRYLAGLWEKTLLVDLCWSTKGAKLERRPNPMRYPTWSWACVPNGVTWQPIRKSDDFNAQNCQIKEILCVAVGPEALGQLSEARLTLNGQLLEAIIFPGNNLSLQVFTGFSYETWIGFWPDFDFDTPGTFQLCLPARVYVLLIGVYQLFEPSYISLVLRKRRSAETEFFERIGYLEICNRFNKPNYKIESFYDGLKSQPKIDILLV